jgi:hypothetical protein
MFSKQKEGEKLKWRKLYKKIRLLLYPYKKYSKSHGWSLGNLLETLKRNVVWWVRLIEV